MSEITNPYIYIPDPNKSRALFNAKLYFGIPDTDPTQSSNQKLVKGIQEDGISVSLPQPVLTNSGGVPEYLGSPIRLDVSGDYSLTVLDRLDVQTYLAPRISNPESGSAGFSGVVATEEVTLSVGQTTVPIINLGANESVVYIQTLIGDQGFLAKDIDYTITNSTTIELTSSKNAGDKLIFRQNDPLGQLVPVNDDAQSLLVFPILTDAQASAVASNLVAGDTVTLNGLIVDGDGLGGDKYKVIVTAFANDGVNYLDLNGTLQLELKNNYYRLQNYSETIASGVIVAGVLNLNLDLGAVQTVLLTESLTDITFTNKNPSSTYSSTISLRVTQDGTGGFGIAWPVSIIWSGGVAPTITAAANSIDMFGFTTFDAGVTWYGFSLGADFK